ncbi:MAG: prolipoprotein diacylglyceryl transferase [Gemmatimonadetes bacterium]|nr:prolipoprotein diacylglyceryl transferase [Gemmatimonadota bacterium]
MFPELFRIGNFVVTTFGLMMFLSFVTGAWILGKQLERYGQPKELAWDFLAWVAVAGIIGAKIYYLALHPADLAANFWGSVFSRGGLVWYGGLIGGVIAYYVQVRSRKLPVAVMFDATAPCIAIAYAVGRIGCFLVGDDYGRYTEGPLGVRFPEGSAPPSSAGYLRGLGEDIPASIPDSAIVPVHPTQLYEVGLAGIMFMILWRLGSKRGLRSGQLFAVFLGMYGILRFFIEFVRAKSDRFVLGLSTSQIMSIALLIIAAWLWHRQSTAKPAPLTAHATARPVAAR